ncbi:MAG: hypothetical protein HYU66_29530, partial [Armatimonadetes bacterium]|nr:hypothetical protein [Armatimonadota bacterium]
MKIIHVVLNAHLDPIWLWPWQVGLDSALATCRSACDRLDAHPDAIFSRGEAWVYQMVERIDPPLFERIRAHVAAGRWEIVGGWWIQPDCNLPSGFGLERQVQVGREYFLDRFGRFPRVAYNVDTFGHCATLPGILSAAGQDRYVFMRPQEHEKQLPARLFRWRGYPDGPEVTAFRIAGAYCTGDRLDPGVLHRAVRELPEGAEHTMCFVGVGDHGGGPTEAQLTWLEGNREALPGWRAEYSSPSRFFAAVESANDQLPLYVGELQHHAVGCYSVYRPVKVGVRRAEHRLRQAELAAEDTPENRQKLTEAWRTTCFHQFHDTLGGTCLQSAYPQVLDQLGGAAAVGDDLLQVELRRRVAMLPPDERQRIVLLNASDLPWDGYAEVEVWHDLYWPEHWRLLDEGGTPIPHQLIDGEANLGGKGMARVLFPIAMGAGEQRVVRVDTEGGEAAAVEPEMLTSRADGLFSGGSGGVWWDEFGHMDLESDHLDLPRLQLTEDITDTWSHSVDRYPEGPVEIPHWNEPAPIERGPQRAATLVTGTLGRSDLRAEWRIYRHQRFVELLLRVHWRELRRILKMVLLPDGRFEQRVDGIPGGWLERDLDGAERPVRDFVRLTHAFQELSEAAPDAAHEENRDDPDRPFGIVCPDVFAADATPDRARLTLLRSPLMAHHDFAPQPRPRAIPSDQGVHEFRFRFFSGPDVTPELLDRHAMMLHRPLAIAT